MSRGVIALIALVIVLFVLADASVYTVDQTEQALITQFGEPVRVVTQPGLHFKKPFVQTVILFEKRLLTAEIPAAQVTLGDQRRLIVDSFVVYRIVNPLLYYQSVGTAEGAVDSRLNAIVSGSLFRVLGDNTLSQVLSLDRDRIMAQIRTDVNAAMPAFGVSVLDVRIRRADLPQENTQAILQRMQSERQRVAALARAEGAEASAKIRADADRERTVLLAQANATADRLRGEGEAEATGIYAKAFSQDPWFFGVWRTLQGYRDALAGGAARLVITPDNAYLRYLQVPPIPPKP
ncbi:MAG TPA: protease modulator HflC [Acetobacteraceae bacterium]|jgi:modulator of FtsH protease HflC|nr:protease modulator HflC [Acetobacteraceae bacterium]